VKILSAVSEIYPLIKTGGLGDVVGALPAALKIHGVAVVTLVPGYPQLLKALDRAQPVLEIADLFGGRARVLRAFVSGLDLFVIDAPHLYDRPGTPYANTQGEDWPDNALRFGALSWMAARIGLGDIPEFVPDVVHCHDWQAGLVPVYIAFAGARVATVITIHNLAYQGKFPAHFLSALRLPQSAFSIHGVEYYGGIGFLKAALRFADRITTVSPTYAAEILTSENGLGLEGLLRSRSAVLTGIANGIDTKVWDPENDERRSPKSVATGVQHLGASPAFRFERRPEPHPHGGCQPAGLAKGPGPSCRRRARAPRARDAVRNSGNRGLRSRAAIARARVSVSRASRMHYRLRRGFGTSCSGGRRRVVHSIALRALRYHAALRNALWRGSSRSQSWRPCRHRDGC